MRDSKTSAIVIGPYVRPLVRESRRGRALKRRGGLEYATANAEAIAVVASAAVEIRAESVSASAKSSRYTRLAVLLSTSPLTRGRSSLPEKTSSS